MESGRESQPAWNLLILVYCPNAYQEDDYILFGNSGGAGLLGGEADGKRRASSYAMPFPFMLVFLGVKSFTIPGSLVWQMSALGEVKKRYI